MEIFFVIAIIILILIIFGSRKDYNRVMTEFNKELAEEGKELKRVAEEEMAKMKCSKGGNCEYELKDKTVEPLYGWGYEITGHYECSKCKTVRDEIIQYPS